MNVPLLNQREYGAHRGVGQPAVSMMIRDGRIPPTALIDGKIDRDRADAALEANTDHTKPKGRPRRGSGDPKAGQNGGEPGTNGAYDSATGTLAAHRAERESLRVELERLDLAERRGESVKRADVKRELFDLARLTRDRVMGVPAKMAVELAAEPDPAVIRTMLDDALRAALETLGGEP